MSWTCGPGSDAHGDVPEAQMRKSELRGLMISLSLGDEDARCRGDDGVVLVNGFAVFACLVDVQ